MMFIRVVELDVSMLNKPGAVQRISCTQMIQLGAIKKIDEHLDKYKVKLPEPPPSKPDTFTNRLLGFAKLINPFKKYVPLAREATQEFDPIHQEMVKRLAPSLVEMGVKKVFFARSRSCSPQEITEFFIHRYDVFEMEGNQKWKNYLKEDVW